MSRDLNDLREKLLRELGDKDLRPVSDQPQKDFLYLMDLPDSEFVHFGLDLAVSLAIQGRWADARNSVRRYRTLVAGNDDANISALIFEMRCLYEMESFTEVLALGQVPLSEKHHLITANYLMALSFE